MTRLHRSAPIIALLVSACDGENGTSPGPLSELDVLREDLSVYQNIEAAVGDGYEQFTDCMEQPPDGGMGYHFINRAHIADGVRKDRPEMLLYEPQEDGSLRLVGIEYYVPFRVWQAERPPALLGRDFTAHGDTQTYILHVWLWKENPAGIFEDWNPDVSCAHVGAEVAGADRHTH